MILNRGGEPSGGEASGSGRNGFDAMSGGAGTPELCPPRPIPDGVRVYCSYWPDPCTTLSPRLRGPGSQDSVARAAGSKGSSSS
jgi:hypothetical protein